jgi:hypothetical protein
MKGKKKEEVLFTSLIQEGAALGTVPRSLDMAGDFVQLNPMGLVRNKTF